MKVTLLGPGPKSLGLEPLDRYFEKYLPKMTHGGIFYLATALADSSSLEFLKKYLPGLRRGGAKLKAVIGVDLGISTEALKEIKRLFGRENTFIYHNPADSAFHPKLFLMKVSEKLAIIVVGSSNLTAAGFSKNFEMNIGFELNLQRDEDRGLFNIFVDKYTRLINLDSILPLTSHLISRLARTRVPKIPRAVRPVRLSDIFKGEAHGWEMPEVEKTPTFLMTLSYNDVSGVRGDQYIRIPVRAVKINPDFWGWKNLFAPSPRAGNPQRTLDVICLGRIRPRRMYFVESPDEFRLVMPEIYNLGRKYVGSILKIIRANGRYKVGIFQRGHRMYKSYLKICKNKCPRGKARVPKIWGYA